MPQVNSPMQISTAAYGGYAPTTSAGYGSYESQPPSAMVLGNPATIVTLSSGLTPGPNGDNGAVAQNNAGGAVASTPDSVTATTPTPQSGSSWWSSFFTSIPSAIGQTVEGDWNLVTGSSNQSAMGAGSYVSNQAVVAAGGAAGAVQASLDTTLPAAGNAVKDVVSDFSMTSFLVIAVILGAVAYLIGSGNIKKVIP